MYTDKTLTLRKSIVYASELRNFLAFLHSKTAISFNILLVLQILCRYTKFRNVPTKLWKSIIGGGGGLPPALPPPPPPGYANGWQFQGSRCMIWPGICDINLVKLCNVGGNAICRAFGKDYFSFWLADQIGHVENGFSNRNCIIPFFGPTCQLKYRKLKQFENKGRSHPLTLKCGIFPPENSPEKMWSRF